MAKLDTTVLPIAFKKLAFDTILLEWTQQWNEGKFGQQLFGFTLSPDLHLYLVNDGGEYSYMIVAEVDGSAAPGTPSEGSWNDNARLGFQYRFDLDIKVTRPDGTLLSGGESMTPKVALPNNINQITEVTSSVSSEYSDTYQVVSDGSSTSSSYTSTTEKKKSSGKSFMVTDWGVIDRSSPQLGLASWTWHQQNPYDIYTLEPQNYGDWFEKSIDGKHPHDVAKLSRFTLPINTVSTWRVDHKLVEQGSLPVRVEITATLHVAGVSNRDFHLPGRKDEKTGHYKLWTGARSRSMVKVIDLAEEVGWWIPAAYTYTTPTNAPAFVGLGNWDEVLSDYPNGVWKSGYRVRYAVSFYSEQHGETARGPWTEYTNHGQYIMPQLTDIPMDPSATATERRLYRQFEGEEPVLVKSIPGYGPVGVVHDQNA